MNNDYTIQSAPLQGFTDYIWRRAHAEIFGGIDCYYSPFMRIERNEIMRRDLRDVLPQNNEGVHFIPQILACSPDDTMKTAVTLQELGYHKIDINIECPFPPITKHKKGSGLMPYPDNIKALFEALITLKDIDYSVKMCLGLKQETEWQAILPLMNILNPSHITVHPRTARQQYRGEVNMEQFNMMLSQSRYPIIYNGNVQSIDDVHRLLSISSYKLAGVTIGRALVADPSLMVPEKATASRYRQFHDMLFNEYSTRFQGGDGQILKKMHSFWELYLPQSPKKLRKAILKATTLEKYQTSVSNFWVNSVL